MSVSKYSLMYDELVQGKRLLVTGVTAKLLVNKLHQVTSKLRKEAVAMGYSFSPVRVNTLSTEQGVEVWFSDPEPTAVCFTVIPEPSTGDKT